MAKRPNICTYEEVYNSEHVDFLCDPDFNDCRIIAEGDSWFTLGGNSLRNPWFSNTLFSLRFPKDTLLLNLANPGDTIKHISAMPRDHTFKFAIEEHDSHTWNAIILSAGGNDLIDKAHTLILNKPERRNVTINTPADYCHPAAVNHFLNNLDFHFRRLAAIRGSHRIPMLIHTYDYPTPRNAPARFFGVGLIGPWLYETMINAEIPKQDWVDLSDYLFDQLAEKILSLSVGANRIPDFHVVDTRNSLIRAQLDSRRNSGDWLNEIHPNKNGYKKIAKLIISKLTALGLT